MSRLILRSLPYVPKAPLVLPLAISVGFRNVLAPRYGLYTVELDATVLLDFLLSVGTFRYVVKLDLYVPSASDLVNRKLLDRVAAACPYIEELSMLIVFIKRGTSGLGLEHLGGIRNMERLDSLRIVGCITPTFSLLSEIAPASLRSYNCGNALVGSGHSADSKFKELPRQLTHLDISSPHSANDTLDHLADLPPKLRSLNCHGCVFSANAPLARSGNYWAVNTNDGTGGNNNSSGISMPLSDEASYNCFDFSLLPRDLRVAKLNRSCRPGVFIKNMRQLPDLLTYLDLSSCGLRGDISKELSALPPYLRTLNLKENGLTCGPDGIDWMLPDLLVDVDISFNHLTGDIHFASLPPNLQSFRARSNRFEKNLSDGPKGPDAKGLSTFADLPRSLKLLDLSRNRGIRTTASAASTATCLSELPPEMEALDLSETEVGGFFDLRLMPMSMRNVTMFAENLLSANPNIEEKLSWFDTTLKGDERDQQRKSIRENVEKRQQLNSKFSVDVNFYF